MSHTAAESLLVELFTEELPPKALAKLSNVFADTLAAYLAEHGLRLSDAKVTPFASPRRLGVLLSDVCTQAAAREVVEKIMPVRVALDESGQATAALLKKLAARGLSADVIATFERRMDGKAESLFYRYTAEGAKLADILSHGLELAVKKLPIPKVMRWGDRDVTFVRPVHGLMCMHGDRVVPAHVLGLTSGRTTGGHRFLSSGELTVPDAQSYPRVMHDEGRVIASFEARRELIRHKLNEHANALNARLAADDALLDEVTALVEWPVVLEGQFSADFLRVPQECLILTMQQNQKYFPLLDAAGKLMNRFLLVSNLASKDPAAVIAGNERVLRARLSDAQFFFEQDCKVTLESRLARLADVVYHNKLGSQLQRVQRVQRLAREIAELLAIDPTEAVRAAQLAKADLVSDMVGEFPELQGIMGMYYAQRDGESAAVAAAIEGHYHPRFAGDSLPDGRVACVVALADKLEILAGIWGIGLIPTGDKDPFGLRRQVLGVLRILMEARLPLDLRELFERAVSAFEPNTLAADTAAALYEFALERLRHYLSQSARLDEVDAVLALRPSRLEDLQVRLQAVATFRTLPESAALAAAMKRVNNILRKNAAELTVECHIQPALFQEAAEHALFNALESTAPEVESAVAAQQYAAALNRLAQLKTPVDAFFDEVMVMADEVAVRQNRLALLRRLADLLGGVADIALLAE